MLATPASKRPWRELEVLLGRLHRLLGGADALLGLAQVEVGLLDLLPDLQLGVAHPGLGRLEVGLGLLVAGDLVAAVEDGPVELRPTCHSLPESMKPLVDRELAAGKPVTPVTP